MAKEYKRAVYLDQLAKDWKGQDLASILDLARAGKLSLWYVFEGVNVDGTPVTIRVPVSILNEIDASKTGSVVNAERLECIDKSGQSIKVEPLLEWCFEDGERGQRQKLVLELWPLRMFAYQEDVEALDVELKNGPDTPREPCASHANGEQKRGGARKGLLRESVEYLYNKLFEEGNTLVLQSGNIQQFMKQLRDCTLASNGNFSEYVAVRLKEVRISGGSWRITTQRTELGKGKYLDSQQKKLNSVSKIMKILREEKPLTP